MNDKWNINFSRTGEDARNAPREVLKDLMRFTTIEIPEVEKSGDEKAVIHDLNQAAGRVLEELGLQSYHIPEELIHVVEENDFRRHPPVEEHGTSTAFSHHGHMFVPRSDRFIFSLSHEMAHGFSFLWMIYGPSVPVEGGAILRRNAKRTGYHFWSLDGKHEGFVALNEGLTELLAIRLRSVFADIRSLSRKEKDHLVLTNTYVVPIILLSALFNKYGGEEKTSMQQNYLKALITGDLSILKELNQMHKGAVKVLAETGLSFNDCKRAAEALGVLEEFMSKIEPLLKSGDQDKE